MSQTMNDKFIYQTEILNNLIRLEEEINDDVLVSIINLPCGSGKSMICSDLCLQNKQFKLPTLIIVNKFTINQWAHLLDKKNIKYYISSKEEGLTQDMMNRDNIIILMLDIVFDFNTSATNTMYTYFFHRVILDEVSSSINNLIYAKSIILLSNTYQEINKYIDQSDFYKNYFKDRPLDELCVKHDTKVYMKTQLIEKKIFRFKNRNILSNIINIVNNPNNSYTNYSIIYANGSNINDINSYLIKVYRLHVLIISSFMNSQEIMNAQSMFNQGKNNIILIDNDMNISGISFKRANMIVFYDTVNDPFNRIQSIGRALRVTNRNKFLYVYEIINSDK